MRALGYLLLAASLTVGAAEASAAGSLGPLPAVAGAEAQGGGAGPPSSPAPSAPRVEASAQEAFTAGQRLFDQKKYGEALALFRRAYELSGSPNAHLMVARSLLGLGRSAEAYEEMSATLREATSRAESEPRYVPTRDAAAAELALLDRRVGKVIVVLVEPGSGAAVALNGAVLPPQRVGVPVAVEPGSVAVEAEREGKPAARREVVVRAGETKTVAISFAEGAGAPGGGEPIAQRDEGTLRPAASAPSSGGLTRALGYGAAGVGVAGIVAFGVAGSMAESQFRTLKEECRGRCSDPKYASVVDMGEALDTVANIGLAVGVAGLVGGTALILVGGRSKARGVSAYVTPGGLGLRGSF